MSLKLILMVNLASTLMMVGVIWIVQQVHYPLFSRIRTEHFLRSVHNHISRMALFVMAIMLLELITSFALIFELPPRISLASIMLGLGLVGIISFATVFINVPQHNTLTLGFVIDEHRVLMMTNWLRTIAWSARGMMMLGIV